MAENMGKWPSGHGQLTKIRPPEGYGGKTITTAAQSGYDRHGLEGYLGNVGLIPGPYQKSPIFCFDLGEVRSMVR